MSRKAVIAHQAAEDSAAEASMGVAARSPCLGSREPPEGKRLFCYGKLSRLIDACSGMHCGIGTAPDGRWPMSAIVLVALYAIAPFNVAIPFVGIMHEGVLIPSVLHLMGSAVCQARCYADVANGGIQTGNVT